MGSRSGCVILKSFSEDIQFLADAWGCGSMSNVLDDFLMVSASKQVSDGRLSAFLSLCRLLGIPVVVEKNETGTCLVFLGIMLDTIRMEARLPQDKLQKCLRLIQSYIQLQKISFKQLESLAGQLNFACKVVRPGQPFLHWLYNLMEGMQNYNGVTLFTPLFTLTNSDTHI